MLKIETFLKTDKGFVDINDFNEEIIDPDYIRGALILNVNGVQIIDVELWDYVDQLWSYITEGICSIKNGKSFDTYFPDQPVKLSFDIKDGDMVDISIDFNKKNSMVSKKEFLSEFKTSGLNFFERMKILLPSQLEVWEDNCVKLRNL